MKCHLWIWRQRENIFKSGTTKYRLSPCKHTTFTDQTLARNTLFLPALVLFSLVPQAHQSVTHCSPEQNQPGHTRAVRHSLCVRALGWSCRGATSTEPHPALQQTPPQPCCQLPNHLNPSKKASSSLLLLTRAHKEHQVLKFFNHISFVNLLARQQTASDSMRKGIKSICNPFATSVQMLIITCQETQRAQLYLVTGATIPSNQRLKA